MPRWPLAAALLLAAAPAAAAELLECRFRGENAWVPSVVVIEPGREGDTVLVNDPLVRAFRGRPAEARVEVDNAARTTFTWQLRVQSHQNQHATLQLRMTRLKRDGSASISVRPLGFRGPFGGQGSCRSISGRLG